MKTSPKPNPIEAERARIRAFLTAEVQDYERQFQEAQAQVAQWNQKMLMASGGGQACTAALKQLDANKEAPQ